MFTQKIKILSLAAALALAGQAEARRTLIDQDANGNPTFQTLSGYCDFNGDDCAPTSLGYTVDFGDNNPASSLILYGNGLVSFGDDPVSFLDDGSGSASFSGGRTIYASLNNTIDSDFNGSGDLVFFQSGQLSFSGNTAMARWNACSGTNACSPVDGLDIVPQANGLQINLIYYGTPPVVPISGVSIAGVTARPNAGGYFIPALVTFSSGPVTGAVPEPASWMMMMTGFGLMGFAMRRKKRFARPSFVSRA